MQATSYQQELTTLRLQLQHYQDQEAQRQRMFMGSGAYFSGVNGEWPYASETEEQRTKKSAALQRALDLLEEKIGAEALAKVLAGGAYQVKSKHWSNVVYLIPKTGADRIKVVADGSVVTESCLVTTDYDLPWPDVLLHRITALEADESIVFETGVLHTITRPGWIARLAKKFKGLVPP